MKITRVSPLTGKTTTLDLDITNEQAAELRSSSVRRLIQEILPNLSASDREFVLTGYTKEDWDWLFPPGHDEPNEP